MIVKMQGMAVEEVLALCTVVRRRLQAKNNTRCCLFVCRSLAVAMEDQQSTEPFEYLAQESTHSTRKNWERGLSNSGAHRMLKKIIGEVRTETRETSARESMLRVIVGEKCAMAVAKYQRNVRKTCNKCTVAVDKRDVRFGGLERSAVHTVTRHRHANPAVGRNNLTGRSREVNSKVINTNWLVPAVPFPTKKACLFFFFCSL